MSAYDAMLLNPQQTVRRFHNTVRVGNELAVLVRQTDAALIDKCWKRYT